MVWNRGLIRSAHAARETGSTLSQIAMKYHGGGHKKAAGFTVEGDDPWALIDGIVTDVKEQLAQ